MAFIIDTQYRDALMGAFCSSPTAPNALSLFFQPQVNMHTGDVLGYEALLRWFDPTFGYVSPEKCLEIVDFYHLNDHLNQWLIIQAVSSLTKIQPHQYITIN